MQEEPRKSGKVLIAKAVGLGGCLVALLGFFGEQTWSQFVGMRSGIHTLDARLAGVEGRLDDRDGDRREDSAQWRALNKADQRLAEVFIRVRVVEELIRHHDVLGRAGRHGMAEPEKAAEELPPPPPPPPESDPESLEQAEETRMAPERQRALMNEVRTMRSMRRGDSEYRSDMMRQQPANKGDM